MTEPIIPADYLPEPDCLKDKVILITGAAGAIGGALSLACARLGARVVMLDINEKGMNAIYDTIDDEGLPPATLVPLDLLQTTRESYEELAGMLKDEFGKLDGLIHCATMLGALCPLELYDDSNWGKVMQVNLNAPYLLTRACLPLLRESGSASVIFTSSDVGRKGKAYWGAYGISNFALEGMAQTWAKELENDNIKVMTIDPGVVQSSFRASAFPGEDPTTLKEPGEILGKYIYCFAAN